jgi:WD40 repeat protein
MPRCCLLPCPPTTVSVSVSVSVSSPSTHQPPFCTCCLCLSSPQGWLAVGGDNGLLQVMGMKRVSVGGPVAPTAVLPPETLLGHQGAVSALAWNDINDVLASGDDVGQVVIWQQRDDGRQLEESSNWESVAKPESQWVAGDTLDQNKDGAVTGLTWSPDGAHICVVRAPPVRCPSSTGTTMQHLICLPGDLAWSASRVI